MVKGPVSEVEKIKMMASANLLVIPKHQALPLTVDEAISVGIPIVAYNYSPPLREIYGEDAPLLVKKMGDAKAFAEAILKILSLPLTERLKLSRPPEGVVKRYTWEETMRWERIIYEYAIRARSVRNCEA
ncbi:MAG: glycosyltransferase [Candidatus Bathyarchaeia archaeon]